ncbi:hypothetical protein [Shouchella clausii]|uniref:Uncharacterized protein n=1 Tax=Shouchella clausii TaxID=79880 RepID=A0A268NW13_SHOCL|nr:hypothetical protein [Shouchella clausii]PAE87727.1 hypothetical protein CHH72_16960 [Shouchella clausii]
MVKKMIPRTMFMVLAFVIVLSVFLPMGRAMLAAEDEGVSDLSLYQRASELTREFATALAPGSGVERMYMIETTSGGSGDLLVAGNAGAFLGYPDISSDDSAIIGWLMNSYTAASETITYDQLMHVVGDGNDSIYQAARSNPFFQYAGYGEVLTDMGLISTVRPGLSGIISFLGSGIMILVYFLANTAPFLFRGALMILTTLNPFRLFETVLNGTASADLGILSGVAEYVGSMYKAVQDFSIMFLFPALLAVTAFTVLVFQKGSAMKRFARYGVRVFMLFAGLPLIGATYTGLINDLDSKVSVGSEYADYLVLSSYVDFENWVKYSRLAPPSDVGILHPRFNDDAERTISNRELILKINGARANSSRANDLKDRYSATSDIGEIFNEGGARKDADSDVISVGEKSTFLDVMNLLTRHMTSATYTSSDYNGEVSGQIQKIRARDNSEENNKNIVKMFSLSSSDHRTWIDKTIFGDSEEWMEPINWNGVEGKGSEDGDNKRNSAKGLFTEGNALNPMFQFGNYRMNIYNSGDLRYDRQKGYVTPDMPSIMERKTAPIGSDRASTVGGLSPIAMYNFLNTTFSNTGLTVYSPEKTASDLSRDAYASVTFGGSGLSSFTRWTENVTVMFSLAILSIGYGVMMISLAIKSIPRILSGVFGTALGSIAFTTKLLISTAVLIIQIIGMIFLYALSENIIMTMLLNFNSLVDMGSSYFNGAGLILDFLGSFLVIVVTATVTILMIRNVKVFKELTEEVTTNAINRLMGALDTSTGGKGLDVSKMSGGRVGGDGKLTDAAKQGDGLIGGGLVGGAAGLLSAAHGIEAKREQFAQERGEDTGGLGAKIKARAGTAKDLMSAKGKDVAKGLVGINGKSLERELDAKDRQANSMLYNDNALDRFKESRAQDATENDENETSTTNTGQTTIDENGNVLDANGDVISPNSPVGMAGVRPMTTEAGALLDADGNPYTDEVGNVFYQNDKGQLVDEDGNLVALDKDGTLQPLDSIPDHNGKPVSALKEAKKLDAMRFDADKYDAMTKELDATHYGLDKDGNVVGSDGEMLSLKGSDDPVQLDDEGFITDSEGNRVSAEDIIGPIDKRGFEMVEDAETGETHLKHKGDEAMKNAALPVVSDASKEESDDQNLTTLAKQSNRANALAKRADERVEELKANGASPYAIMQAQRYADKANKNARSSQQAFNQAMQASAKGAKGGPGKAAVRQPVTDEHVQSAARRVGAEKASLKESVGKLKQMHENGAPPKVIARQKREVDAQRQSLRRAMDMEQDLRTAKSAGRSYSEVHNARSRVESAEQLFQKAQDAHAEAIANGQPREVIQKREQKMNHASNVLSKAQSNLSRVSQKPSGTPEQIDQAIAEYQQAQAHYKQAQTNTQRLAQQKASRQEIHTARKEQAQAKRRLDKSQTAKQRVLDPPGWRKKSELQVPQTQPVPERSASKSYVSLTAAGISNYDDYRKQVTKHAADLQQDQSKLKQAEQRLASLRSNNRPSQVIKQAEEQVKVLKNNVEASQSNLMELKDNAQGLLKNGNFQPVVASRPIRKNGSAIINQMIQLNHSQAMYDKLIHQEKTGILTGEGRKQMKTLSGRLNQMRRDLVRSGIREDAIKDRVGITQSTKHMQQSWDSFVNGTSVEHSDE